MMDLMSSLIVGPWYPCPHSKKTSLLCGLLPLICRYVASLMALMFMGLAWSGGMSWMTLGGIMWSKQKNLTYQTCTFVYWVHKLIFGQMEVRWLSMESVVPLNGRLADHWPFYMITIPFYQEHMGITMLKLCSWLAQWIFVSVMMQTVICPGHRRNSWSGTFTLATWICPWSNS